MPFEIRITANAQEDLAGLDARWRSAVKDAMRTHLRDTPTKESKSRIKHLRGLRQPQYRLRVEEIRVYYDVEGEHVDILGIVHKDQSDEWLARFGEKL